jgi:hypothetical protein
MIRRLPSLALVLLLLVACGGTGHAVPSATGATPPPLAVEPEPCAAPMEIPEWITPEYVHLLPPPLTTDSVKLPEPATPAAAEAAARWAGCYYGEWSFKGEGDSFSAEAVLHLLDDGRYALALGEGYYKSYLGGHWNAEGDRGFVLSAPLTGGDRLEAACPLAPNEEGELVGLSPCMMWSDGQGGPAPLFLKRQS